MDVRDAWTIDNEPIDTISVAFGSYKFQLTIFWDL